MSWRRCSTSAVVTLSLAIAAPAFAEAPRAAAETVIEGGPFQTDFPGADGGGGGGSPSFGSGGGSSSNGGGAGGQGPQGGNLPANGPRKLGSGGGGRRPSSGGGPGLSLPGIGAFGSMLGYLMIAVLVIVVIALIAWVILSRTPAPELEAAGPAPPDGKKPGRPIRGDLRAQAERLALQGKYEEAIHLLLLAAILHLSTGVTPPESRTSRELLSHFRLDLNSKEAFSALVLAVERSLFGGQALGADEWRECAGRHDALVRVTS